MTIQDFRIPAISQMKAVEAWLCRFLQDKKTTRESGQIIGRMLEFLNQKWNEIEDGYDSIFGKDVKDGVERPRVPELDDPLTLVTLVAYLPKDANESELDLYGTFDLYCQEIKTQQENYWRWTRFDSPEHLRFLNGVEVPKAGFRWEVISMATHRNKAPKNIRTHKSPHLGIYATATTHPKWVQAMNGDSVPYVWVPGLQVQGSYWDQVPDLGLGQISRMVCLNAQVETTDPSLEWAVPVLRESLHFPL